jgi:hypothetical protein
LYNAAMRLWIGPLVAIVAIAGYFAVLLSWPATRDVPWPSYVLLALALAASTFALLRAVRARRRIALAALAGAVSVGLAALFLSYTFAFTELPEVPGALAVGAPAPALVLVDDRGAQVDVAALARDKLVLVFYRGHW